MRIVVLILVFSTGICAAQTLTACQWLSTGSAVSVLGGPVVLNSQVDDSSMGMCRFTRASGDEKRSLEITIGKKDTHACAPDSAKVVALGNDAVQCRNTDEQGQTLDVIAGHIRQLFFVVSMANIPGAAKAPSATGRPADPYAGSILERVAEQVAGNLY